MEEIMMTEDLLLYTPPFGGKPASSLDILSTAVETSPPLLSVGPEKLQFDAVLSQALPKEIVGGLDGGSECSGLQCFLSSRLLPPSAGTSKVIDNSTWDDVVVSTMETNPCVRQPKKNKPLLKVPCSCLVLIGSMSTVGMPLDGLLKFASKYGISQCQCMKKLNLYQAIVVVKGKNNIMVANGTAKVTYLRTSLPAHFVTLRFLDVLFGEEIQPLLANCSKIIDHNQLQDKLETDEVLQHKFIVEYNLSKETYASDAF
eukprot:6694606-Ditylum_brightwellii.AAC.1